MTLNQWLNQNQVIDVNLGRMRTVPASKVNDDLHKLDDFKVKQVEGNTCWLEKKQLILTKPLG